MLRVTAFLTLCRGSAARRGRDSRGLWVTRRPCSRLPQPRASRKASPLEIFERGGVQKNDWGAGNVVGKGRGGIVEEEYSGMGGALVVKTQGRGGITLVGESSLSGLVGGGARLSFLPVALMNVHKLQRWPQVCACVTQVCTRAPWPQVCVHA
eukprot:2577715-Rhodomonas_salina.3